MAGKKGRQGRPPKPKEAKVLAGTFRPDREPENVPDPIHAEPQMPDYIDGRSAEIWEHLCEQLGPLGRNVLTEADGLMLGVLCKSLAEFEVKPTATREGSLRGWAALFGLTPADRQRIPAVSKPEDEIEYVKPRGAK